MVPIALYFFGFFIVLRILIPQFSQFQIVQKELRDVRDDIALLEGSIETLSALDEDTLDTTLTQLERALPFDQDATLAIAAFNTAALRSNVEVVGYVVSPGTLYEKNTEEPVVQTTSGRDEEAPFLEIELRISSNQIEDLITFIGELESLAPISEVGEFSARNTDGSYNLKFYYKPLNREAIAKRDTVTPLKATDLELLETIKSFSF